MAGSPPYALGSSLESVSSVDFCIAASSPRRLAGRRRCEALRRERQLCLAALRRSQRRNFHSPRSTSSFGGLWKRLSPTGRAKNLSSASEPRDRGTASRRELELRQLEAEFPLNLSPSAASSTSGSTASLDTRACRLSCPHLPATGSLPPPTVPPPNRLHHGAANTPRLPPASARVPLRARAIRSHLRHAPARHSRGLWV